jgi:hypothetical protein
MTFDFVMLAIALGSLALAMGATTVAWRLSRAERRRRAARVASLAAAARAAEGALAGETNLDGPALELRSRDLAAGATGAGTWGARDPELDGLLPDAAVRAQPAALDAREAARSLRTPPWSPLPGLSPHRGRDGRSSAGSPPAVRWEQPRAIPRAAHAIVDDGFPLALAPAARLTDRADIATESDADRAEAARRDASQIFAAIARGSTNRRQRFLAAIAAALLILIASIGYFAFGGQPSPPASAAAPVQTPVVELLALDHGRAGAQLEIRGVVRNPDSGATLEELRAVVQLLDAGGRPIAGTLHLVRPGTFGPGAEARFVVPLHAPRSAARYRVSFRDASGEVAHVDRRRDIAIARSTS